ncbi:universal stress protein PHOS32-like isoform X1 [Sesbania bispinosa]|nr:universal stress protein PHOS32-like isoform X1 [Sesbania bispinosa]
MGSHGFCAAQCRSESRLRSVNDYFLQHCVYPIVVLRYPDDKDGRCHSGAERGGRGKDRGGATA